jgi:hypothetical protein
LNRFHSDTRAAFQARIGEWPLRRYGGSVRSPWMGPPPYWGGKMPDDHHPDALRELATECVALAERTADPNIRVELLLIAQKWITIANGRLAITELSDETSLVPK